MPATEMLLIVLIIAVLVAGVLQVIALLRGRRSYDDSQKALVDANASLREVSSELARAQAQAERAQALELEMRAATEEITAKREDLAGKSSQLDAVEKALAVANAQLIELTATNKNIVESKGALLESNARLEQEVKSAKQREIETTTLLAGAKEEMAKEFKIMANTLLEEKGAKLTEQQRSTLSTLLDPFNETLKDFKGKVESAREADVAARAGLIAQILELTKLNQDIGAKAQSLTNALRGESKTRGIWGEAVLQRILELAGLREGMEFRTQVSHKVEGTDERRVPDVVLDLPQDRSIVIDAKVSLVAYERFVSSSGDEQVRMAALDDHSASIKRHIQDLSKKNYPSLYNLKSVDFTLLFVPIESALMAASEADPNLAQYALERHVALVSPNTLFTVLRTIEYIWRVDKTTRSMEEIVKRGGLMYDAAVRFSEHVVSINDALGKATIAAQSAEKALINPRNGLVRQAEQLRDLGIKPKKSMPKRLSSNSDGTKPTDSLDSGLEHDSSDTDNEADEEA
ncbi:DNA recombination protein RmuC [Rhodanobacter koreensis]